MGYKAFEWVLWFSGPLPMYVTRSVCLQNSSLPYTLCANLWTACLDTPIFSDTFFYGMTANIQFYDDFIYQEIAKAPQARAIPMNQLLRDEAQQAFVDWQHNNKKIAYWYCLKSDSLQGESFSNARASSWNYISNNHFQWIVMNQCISVCVAFMPYLCRICHMFVPRTPGAFTYLITVRRNLRCICLQLQYIIPHASGETYRPKVAVFWRIKNK